jgi:hypothetical protein
MKIDLKWMIGRRIENLGKQDYTWFFNFDGGGIITTESTWRLVTEKGIKATSEDHGHKFGHEAPLDAIDVLKRTIGKQIIEQYKLDPRTGDLLLIFDNKCELQFLNLSSGYESWHMIHGVQEIICMGGGKLHEMQESKVIDS